MFEALLETNGLDGEPSRRQLSPPFVQATLTSGCEFTSHTTAKSTTGCCVAL